MKRNTIVEVARQPILVVRTARKVSYALSEYMNPFPLSNLKLRRAMTWVVAAAMFCGSISMAANAQPGTLAVPEPTLLETIAKQRGTTIILSEEVGRVESSDSQAIVTALILENSHYRPSRVRGIRIDLRNESSTDHIFVEESELVHLKYELVGLDCGIARVRNQSGSAYRMNGVGRCRPSQTIPQAYCPGYYIAPDSEGLALSAFNGGNFSFPSARPAALAGAIGRAMSEFGIDDEEPAPMSYPLSPDDLDQIIASATHHFPELASSPGVKAAGYDGPDKKSSATVFFWPYERVGGMAYSRLVECEAIGTVGEGWNCDGGRPRAYLTVPEQEFEVVVTDELDRETAFALIEFAKLRLMDEPNYADMEDWKFTLIRVPDQALEAFLVAGRDVTFGSVSFVIKEAPQDVEERFELVRIHRSSRDNCGGT